MLGMLRSAWIWGASLFLILSWTLVLAVVRVFDFDPARRRTARWFRRLGRVLAKVHPWRLHIKGEEHIVPGKT